MRELVIALLFVTFGSALAGCSNAPRSAAFSAIPSGALGRSIRLGRDIFNDPQQYVPGDVSAKMSCSACHIAAGTVARGGSLVGVYARFPQWNPRAKRVITLQDRIAECFLYSMNGRAPSFSSREMIALVAYMAWLSRGVRVGQAAPADASDVVVLPRGAPDLRRGAVLYVQKCSVCHQPNGAGIAGTFPPLWGKASFNSGAGMANVANMTGFVRYNMPKSAPGSLSLAQAYDISAYVLAHERPTFNPHRMIQFQAQPASSF